MDNRKLFEEKLQKQLISIRKNKILSTTVQNELIKHGIMKGETQRIITGKLELKEVDLRKLILLALEVNILTDEDEDISPSKYFSQQVIDNAKELDIKPAFTDAELFNFEPTLLVFQDNYLGTISIKKIQELMECGILKYDFRMQRNPKYERRKDGSFRMVPYVNEKNVKEMETLILNGELESTVITINVLLGSSESGDDIEYNTSDMCLKVNNDADMYIIDGYHRIVASLRALQIDPELEFTFKLNLVNYNLKKAQAALAQMNTVTPMDKTHLMALKESRLADSVVKEIQLNSELKGKVSQTVNLTRVAGHIVSFSTLADSIEEEFRIDNKKDMRVISEYLTNFFDELVSIYPDAFGNNIEKFRKESIVNANAMFVGYIVLASRMKKEGISITELENILNNIDFSRTNTVWKQYNILDDDLNIRNKSKRGIKQFFRELNIGEVANHA